jgi:hypothetical protein
MYFTYLLKWTASDIKYYGVRYKDSATLESVGTTYFSSSRYVKQYIKENGTPDFIQIRKIFDTKLQAKRWEEKVIRRVKAITKKDWLNKGNNNSFKDVVCDEEVRRRISDSKKGKRLGTMYNNGVLNKIYKSTDVVPGGWVKGRLMSEKNIQHITNLNTSILTSEKRRLAGAKASITLTGVKKPPGHGTNVSKATKGVSKPWQQGDRNVSKRLEVREKIKESWKTRVIGKWYTDGNKNLYIKPDQNIPEGFCRGRSKLKT